LPSSPRLKPNGTVGPTEISASCLLVGLHLADALTDPIALGFGESGGDGQKQLAHGVAGNVAAKVKQAKRDPALAQVLDTVARRRPSGTACRASAR
jgi:hypothetical protein